MAATSIAFSSITVCASAEETTDIFDNTTEYSEEFTEEDTNEEASSSARRTALWVVTEDNVRMRRTPSLSGEVLMLLYKGEYLYEGTPKNMLMLTDIRGSLLVATEQAGPGMLHLII